MDSKIPDKKLTDNEIVKAIDKCLRADDCHTSECPFFGGSKDGWDCQLVALSLARDLINSQYEDLYHALSKNEMLREEIKSQKAEIEMLQGAIDEQDIEVASLWKRIEEIKYETIKEFAERLKKAKHITKDDKDGKLHLLIELDEFDNLVKEMVGDA